MGRVDLREEVIQVTKIREQIVIDWQRSVQIRQNSEALSLNLILR